MANQRKKAKKLSDMMTSIAPLLQMASAKPSFSQDQRDRLDLLNEEQLDAMWDAQSDITLGSQTDWYDMQQNLDMDAGLTEDESYDLRLNSSDAILPITDSEAFLFSDAMSPFEQRRANTRMDPRAIQDENAREQELKRQILRMQFNKGGSSY